MTERPLVSFVMGVYNTESFDDLCRSIDSMLNQTYKNIEIVICDDCSTNGIDSLLKKEYGNDIRVKLLRNDQNLQLGRTLNRCIKVAKGDYIARQDDDDYSDLLRIEKQMDVLLNHNEFDFVSTGLAKFDKEKIWDKVVPKEFPVKRDFRINSQHVHASTVFRKDCLERVGGYRVSPETSRCEDYDLFMRIYATGMKGYNIQEVLYYYNYPQNNRKSLCYKNRIKEAIVRYKGFRAMRLPVVDYIFVLKPLIAGLLSEKSIYRIKKFFERNNK